MSIRQRITFLLLAMGFAPMVLVLILFFYNLNQANQLAVTDARLALEQAGEETIRDKAETVARTLHIYLESHPEIDPRDHEALDSDPAFAALAVQPVGETGYTAVHDANAINHFHVDPRQVERDMHDLAEQLPQFWAIFEKSLSGTVSAGYYDWLEPDGVTVRQKYMVIVPLEGTDYRVAATTYIDEFSAPANALADKLAAVANRSILLTVIISLGIAALAVFAAVFFGGRFTSPIEALTSAAAQIQQGRFDTRITVRSQDEIGKLGAAFNSMASQLKESISGLEQRVTERTQALATVAEVGTAASTILETDKLLQTVVDLTKERFGLYHSHIYLLDETGENLVLAAGAGEPGRIMVAEKRSIPLSRERSLVARAARERQGVTVNDVTQEPDFLPNPLLPDTHAELAVPMLVGADLLGVFDIQSEQVGRFTESDIAIQTTLAAQIASAVQNARLYTQAEASRREAQTLVEFTAEGIAIMDWERGLFVDANERYAQAFGMSVKEVESVGPNEVSPPRQPDGRDSAEKALEMAQIAMEKGQHTFEWVHIKADGTPFDCELSLVRLPGDRPRLRISLVDITERKRAEDAQRRRAEQQEILNTITQKIQNAATVEDALQVTARELGRALGKKQTRVALETETTAEQQ